LDEHDAPPTWRKSSFSQGGDCVEWSCGASAVYVRTSKDPHSQVLEFTLPEWQAFIDGVKSGEADLKRPD
jgi:Domain of unknown function (DUF397)